MAIELKPCPFCGGSDLATTAEVKAQALEDAGRDMVEHFREQGLDMTMALAVQEGLRQRAEKLREEINND